jgi:hypothetical protein
VEKTLEAFREALKPLAQLITHSDAAVRGAMLAGFDAATVGSRSDTLRTGWIDLMRVDGDEMVVNGWMLFGDGWPDVVEFVSPAGEHLVAEPQLRQDLAEAFPQVEGSENGGYRAILPRATFAPNGEWKVTIRALQGREEIFRCNVRRREQDPRALVEPRWSGRQLEA